MSREPTLAAGTSARPDLAARIDSEKSRPLPWRTVAKRAVVVLIAGVAIYLVFPAVTEVFASWPRLSTLDPWWLTAARLSGPPSSSGCWRPATPT